MNRNRGFVLLGLGILLTFIFISCDGMIITTETEFVTAKAAPRGYVYDAETGEALEDMTVQLKNTDGEVAYTATSDTDGYYSFNETEYGEFELTAKDADDTYAFTKKIVEISGEEQWLPNIGGFKPGDEVFRIVVFWDRDFADVDSFLSMPDSYTGQADVDPSDFYNTDTSSLYNSGFFPDTSTGRQVLYHGTSISGDDVIMDGSYKVAELDVDNVGAADDLPGGPETMSVFLFPFYDKTHTTDYSPVASDRSGLPTSNTYAWVGTMEYYLDAWASTNNNSSGPSADEDDALLASATISGDAANPVVYIFDGDGNQKGYFTLPKYQNIETASILRINLFYDNTGGEWYQFLPNINAYKDYNSVRALGSYDGSPITIKGKVRR